jgi:hypothetical protein
MISLLGTTEYVHFAAIGKISSASTERMSALRHKAQVMENEKHFAGLEVLDPSRALR